MLPVMASFVVVALVIWVLGRPQASTHDEQCDLDEDCSCGAAA